MTRETLVMDTYSRPTNWLGVGLAGACLLALADMPYGYYQLLRLAVTFYAAWLAWRALELERPVWPWLFGFLAALYNPFFKVSLDKELWEVVNVCTAVLIVIEVWQSRRPVARNDNDQ